MTSERKGRTVFVLFPGISLLLIIGLVTYEALDNVC